MEEMIEELKIMVKDLQKAMIDNFNESNTLIFDLTAENNLLKKDRLELAKALSESIYNGGYLNNVKILELSTNIIKESE